MNSLPPTINPAEKDYNPPRSPPTIVDADSGNEQDLEEETSVIEVESEDEIEVMDVRHRHLVISVEDDEEEADADEVEITGTNPNPSPLRGEAVVVRHNEVPDDDIQIVDERPIARPRLPGVLSFVRFQHMFHQQRHMEAIQRHQHHHHTFVNTPFGPVGTIDTTRARHLRVLRNHQNLARHHLHHHHRIVSQSAREYGEVDRARLENSIMDQIERDNENTLDSRLAQQNLFMRKALLEKLAMAAAEIKGYTNNIGPDSALCCELCGITLGEGIPADFKPDPRYNADFEVYAKEYRVQAPWFCINQCLEADIMLSSRVFAAKCGHTYCGRCVKNIGNRTRRTKATPSGMTITNPQLYAPAKCTAEGCSKKFTAKGFVEIYF